MKIIVEIPNKSIDIAKAYLIPSCDTEEQENELSKACEELKTCTEPMEIDFDETKFHEFKQQVKQMYVAFAVITLSAKMMKEILH